MATSIATPEMVASYIVLLKGMTNKELLDQFATVVRQAAVADFGTDNWSNAIEAFEIVEGIMLARLEG